MLQRIVLAGHRHYWFIMTHNGFNSILEGLAPFRMCSQRWILKGRMASWSNGLAAAFISVDFCRKDFQEALISCAHSYRVSRVFKLLWVGTSKGLPQTWEPEIRNQNHWLHSQGIASAIHSLDRALELLLRIGRKYTSLLSIVAEFLKTHTNQSLACWDLAEGRLSHQTRFSGEGQLFR